MTCMRPKEQCQIQPNHRTSLSWRPQSKGIPSPVCRNLAGQLSSEVIKLAEKTLLLLRSWIKYFATRRYSFMCNVPMVSFKRCKNTLLLLIKIYTLKMNIQCVCISRRFFVGVKLTVMQLANWQTLQTGVQWHSPSRCRYSFLKAKHLRKNLIRLHIYETKKMHYPQSWRRNAVRSLWRYL